MKKLISLILAVLILCTFTVNAFADQNTNCITISNITLQNLKDDNEFKISLDGLEVAIASTANESQNTFSINVFGDDELLLNTSILIDDNTAYITIDGMSSIYSLDINSFLPSNSLSSTQISWEQIVSTIAKIIDNGAINENGTLSDFDIEQVFADKTIHIKFDPADSYTLFDLKDGSDQFSLSATAQNSNREMEFYPLDDVASALDANELTEEQLNTLKSELTDVLVKPVIFMIPSLSAAGVF